MINNLTPNNTQSYQDLLKQIEHEANQIVKESRSKGNFIVCSIEVRDTIRALTYSRYDRPKNKKRRKFLSKKYSESIIKLYKHKNNVKENKDEIL